MSCFNEGYKFICHRFALPIRPFCLGHKLAKISKDLILKSF